MNHVEEEVVRRHVGGGSEALGGLLELTLET
jgi:hypothetical protein